MENKKPSLIRSYILKVILALILVATLVFIFQQKDSFLRYRSFMNDVKVNYMSKDDCKLLMNHPEQATTDELRYHGLFVTEKKVSMKGNVKIIQTFHAQDDRIDQIRLFFNNPGSYTSSGTIYVTLKDAGGNVLSETELESSMIAHNSITSFSFTGSSEELNINHIISKVNNNKNRTGLPVNRGAEYTITVESKGIDSKSPFDIYLMTEPAQDKNTLTVNGDEMAGEHLYATIGYRHFTYTVFTIFIVLIGLGIIFILLPWDKIEEIINRRRNKKHMDEAHVQRFFLRIMFFLTPLVCFYILAKISSLTTPETLVLLFSLRGALNLLIIGFIWWVIYTICNRTKATIAITTFIFFVFGFVNYVLLVFRDSPLIFTDIVNWRTAAQVAGNYTLTFNKASLWAIMLAAIWICVALSLRGNKGLSWKKRIAVLLIACGWGWLFNYEIFQSDLLERNQIRLSSFRPKANYKKNGYTLSFFISIGMSIVEKPKDYSVEHVQELIEGYESDEATIAEKPTKKTPNIIGIMNEAYSELRLINDFKTNKDYMPFYNSLKENTVKGTMHMSIFGGNTASSEFEFLTGNSMEFLPFHCVPYTNMLKTETPSLSWSLAARGYGGNIAFHPGMADSYNRNNAYPLLGFDTHLSYEDLDNPEMIRAYVSDKADYEEIIAQYDKYKKTNQPNPFYLFNVTIQNHSDFKRSSGVVNAGISITDDSVREEEAEQYLNLVKKSDEAMEELIGYFSQVEEPTVLVFFGDHQPRVGNSFYDALFEKSGSDEAPFVKEERKYRVPFMIWANYDIEEESGLHISANYLHSYLLQKIGGEMTGYEKYLMDLYKEMPVISDIACVDSDGHLYDPDNLKDNKVPPERESATTHRLGQLIRDYQNIQYNGFIDTDNRINEFFYLKGAIPEEGSAGAEPDAGDNGR